MSAHAQITAPNEIQADRIRDFLRHMAPQARHNLLVEIERKKMYDEDISGFELILSELRAEFRKSGQSNQRVENPSRYFFKPIEVLLVDRSPERANAGQISRGSLTPIWEWITQCALLSMAREYCDAMKEAISENHLQQAQSIAAGFQSKVAKCLEGMLASDQGLANVRGGLGRYTSSHAGLDDLRKILLALRVRYAIGAFNNALPSKVDKFGGKSLAEVQALLSKFAAEHPEAMPFALTIVAKHLRAPWQLINLVTHGERSISAIDILSAPYAITVSMVLDHLDDKRIELSHALKSKRIEVAKSILTEIYDIEHDFHAQIERLGGTDWGRRLDEVMAMVSSDL